DGAGGDERALLGRLRDHGIARDERGRDLAREDRERKVPWADADEYSAAVEPQLVVLARRAGQHDRRGEEPARLRRVVAQEVHRLADLGDRVRDRLARLR